MWPGFNLLVTLTELTTNETTLCGESICNAHTRFWKDSKTYISCLRGDYDCYYLQIFSGFMALTYPPIVVLGIGNMILLIIMYLKVFGQWLRFSQTSIVLLILDVLFLIYEGICTRFLRVGLPWIGYKGVRFERSGLLGCKLFSFTHSFICATRMNLLLMKTNIICRSFKPDAARSFPVHTVGAYILCCFILGLLQSLVTLLAYEPWLNRDQFICYIGPTLPRMMTTWAAISISLNTHGILQAIGIITCNIIMVMRLEANKIYTSATFSVTKEDSLVYSMMRRITARLERAITYATVQIGYSTVMSIICISKGVLAWIVFAHIYSDKPDNGHDGCKYFNTLRITFYMILWFECFLVTSQLWLFYIWIPEARNFCLHLLTLLAFKNKRIVSLLCTAKMHYATQFTPLSRARKGRRKSPFDFKLYKALRSLSEAIPSYHVNRASQWLMDREDLPPELYVARERLKTVLN